MPRRAEATDHYAGPSVTEAQLKARVLELAHGAGWMVYHRPARYQRNGGGSGYPDLTLARHGRVLWLELKVDKGEVSEAQKAWMQSLPAAHVIRPVDLDTSWFVQLLVHGS